MSSMLSIAVRSVPKSAIRNISNCWEKCLLEVKVVPKHKFYHKYIPQTAEKSWGCSRNMLGPRYQLYTQQNCRLSVSSTLNDKLKCPSFPESISEGDIRWQKKEGESVKADEVIAEIETDKTSIPINAPADGVIQKILVPDGTAVKTGVDVCEFAAGAVGTAPAAAEAKPSVAAEKPKPVEAPKTPAEPKKPAARPPPPSAPASSIPVAAIRHAQALDSATVKMPPADPTKEITGTRTEQRVKMNRMRQKIAQRLKDAQNTNAMLTTFAEIDMSEIMEFRKKHQDAFIKKHGIKMGFMSVFAKASAHALQEQPVVNAVIDGTEIIYRDYVDISVAVATPKGLVVPVIRGVEKMNYAEIELALNALGEKARAGRISIEDMDGGTFTISNGGVFGSLFGTPIINPPQSAILGMHAIFDRPVAYKGQVVIRPIMYVALTYDHRLIDGREAVLFLRKIKAGVEDPGIIVAGL